ncbi:MAG: hypothetical protein ACP5ID_02020 [Conexivisphaera sp.]
MRLLAALALVLLMVPAFPAGAAPTQQQGSLSLISPLPELPVGGGTFYVYAALLTPRGYAPLPQTYLVVNSSNSSVLSVPEGALRGGGYVAIPVIPVSPGAARLTVYAPALGLSANLTVRVGYAVGYPERVLVEPLPPGMLYGENGSVVVELLDAFGNPAPSESGKLVHLYEYPLALASHEPAVYVSPGSYMAYSPLSAGSSPGTTYLIGVAQGLAPSPPASLSVGRTEPELRVTVMPNSTCYPNAGYVIVLVQAVDPSGRPLIVGSPVTVFLSSSNADVVEPLSNYLTIPAGSDHAWVEAEVTGTGRANLTAQAQWFLPGSAAFESEKGIAAPTAVAIYGPGSMAVGQTYPLVIAAVNANGSAVSGPYPAVITSGNPGLISPWPVNASTYSNVNLPTVNATALAAGTALLTASSPGLAAGKMLARAYEPGTYMGGLPSQLAIYGPGELLSGTRAEFYVQLLTSYGYPAPARAPVDVLVQFYPAPGYAGPLPSPIEVTVPAGASCAPFNVTVPGSGSLTIVASAEGVQPASAAVSSLPGPSPVQSNLVAVVVPPQPTMGSSPLLYLFLEDASGNLVSPWIPVNVTVSGPGFSANATIPAGGFYAEIQLPSYPSSASWYIVASAAQLGTRAAFNYSYFPINLTVQAISGMGTPVAGITARVLRGGSEVATVTTGPDGSGVVSLPPGQYVVELPSEASPSQGEVARFEFTPNATSPSVPVNLTSPADVVAYYQLYYQVTVLTPHGTANGSGLFPQGAIDIVSVRPTRILGFPQGYSFVGWTGTYRSSSPSIALRVDSPQLLIATWRADWTLLYVVVAVVVAGAAALALLALNRRRASELRAERAPR